MQNQAVIVFTRYPEPGKAKTRLIPVLGPDGAANLQLRMTRHVLACTAPLQDEARIEVWFEGGDSERMAALFGAGASYRPQPAGDLAQKEMSKVAGPMGGLSLSNISTPPRHNNSERRQ